jgi:hypothetical protein
VKVVVHPVSVVLALADCAVMDGMADPVIDDQLALSVDT